MPYYDPNRDAPPPRPRDALLPEGPAQARIVSAKVARCGTKDGDKMWSLELNSLMGEQASGWEKLNENVIWPGPECTHGDKQGNPGDFARRNFTSFCDALHLTNAQVEAGLADDVATADRAVKGMLLGQLIGFKMANRMQKPYDNKYTQEHVPEHLKSVADACSWFYTTVNELHPADLAAPAPDPSQPSPSAAGQEAPPPGAAPVSPPPATGPPDPWDDQNPEQPPGDDPIPF